MQKQSEVIRSQQQTGLATLSKGVILKEQDSKEVIKHLALLLNRLGKLYLIPGWSEENAVILSEWVFDNYKYEQLEVVTKCLKNPPHTPDNNWRLTPDLIEKWMAIELEKVAEEREKENNQFKEAFKEPLPNIDYASYAKRIEEGKALNNDKPKHWSQDEGYQKFRNERLKQSLKSK